MFLKIKMRIIICILAEFGVVNYNVEKKISIKEKQIIIKRVKLQDYKESLSYRLDMKSLAEEVKKVKIVDEKGNLFMEDNNDKRFFEAVWVWVHNYKGKYYLSYSTGDTHNICYAIGDNQYVPFTYKGIVLKLVLGWINHYSILDFKSKTYLYYHDNEIAGKTHLRNVKVTELKNNIDGTIQNLESFK
jgi:hypothetical protein